MSDDLAPAAVRLGTLVERFGGRLVGDAATLVRGVGTLAEAAPDQISFLSNPRYRAQLGQTRAAAVLVSADEHLVEDKVAAALWLVDNPYLHFARVAQFFAAQLQSPAEPGVHPSAVVDPAARIDGSAHVGAGAVIGERAQIDQDAVIGAGCVVGARARIGRQSVLNPRVTVYPDCVIGVRALIHSGSVIGADGFGFARDGTAWVKIPQTGRVCIGDDVEIGANTTIDRGALGDTVIGDGVKIDNQVQIGHNCRIGEQTAIAGCVGIAGSATIGRRCMIGGAAMIIGHLDIADDVTISVGTLISHSISKPGTYTGFYPASENAAWEKNAAVVRHLDALRDRVRALERQLKKGQGSP